MDALPGEAGAVEVGWSVLPGGGWRGPGSAGGEEWLR